MKSFYCEFTSGSGTTSGHVLAESRSKARYRFFVESGLCEVEWNDDFRDCVGRIRVWRARDVFPPDPALDARLDRANDVLRIISEHGRRFFWNESKGRIARFARIDGYIVFVDDYTGEPILLEPGRQTGFSHGGTLKTLCLALSAYIASGKPVPPGHFGPWPEWVCGGDLWGYGDDMATVRERVLATGVCGATP